MGEPEAAAALAFALNRETCHGGIFSCWSRGHNSGVTGPPRVAEGKTGPPAVGLSEGFAEPLSFAQRMQDIESDMG